MLKTSHRGSYGKVRYGELKVISRQPRATMPSRQVVFKVMRTRAKPGVEPNAHGPGPSRPVNMDDVKRELVLTRRFVPELAFLTAHRLDDKVYASQPRMNSFAE